MTTEHVTKPDITNEDQIDSSQVPSNEVLQRSGTALGGTGITGSELNDAVAKALGRSLKGIDGNDSSGNVYTVLTTDDLVVVNAGTGPEDINEIQLPDLDTVDDGQQFSFFILQLPSQEFIDFTVTDPGSGEAIRGPSQVNKTLQMYTVEALTTTGFGPVWLVKSADLEHGHLVETVSLINPDSMRTDGSASFSTFTDIEWPSILFPTGHDVDSALFALPTPENINVGTGVRRILRVNFGFPVNGVSGDDLAFRLQINSASIVTPTLINSSSTTDTFDQVLDVSGVSTNEGLVMEFDISSIPTGTNQVYLARLTRRDSDVGQSYPNNVHMIGAQIFQSYETGKGDTSI